MEGDTEQPAAEVLPDAGAEKAARVDVLVAQWLHDCIHDSPVSRHTDAYNHLVTSAAPELGRRILKEIA